MNKLPVSQNYNIEKPKKYHSKQKNEKVKGSLSLKNTKTKIKIKKQRNN